jgi:hypothetical protein
MQKMYVQMPLALYDEQTDVVEAEIEVADNYAPLEGHWIFHDIFKGLMLLGPVVYDGSRNAVVLTTAGTTYDYTMTLDEWLQTRPQWYKTEKPFIMIANKKLEEADGTDS